MIDLIVVPGDVSDILAGQTPRSAGLVLWRHALGTLRLLWWCVGGHMCWGAIQQQALQSLPVIKSVI